MSQTDLLLYLRRRPLWTALLAACALFSAQFLFAGHATEHIGHVDDRSCEFCLVYASLDSPLAQSVSTPARPNGAPPREGTRGYDAFRQLLYLAQRARAPPTRVRL